MKKGVNSCKFRGFGFLVGDICNLCKWQTKPFHVHLSSKRDFSEICGFNPNYWKKRVIHSSVVFLIFQGDDVGYIDGKTDSLHFASEFLSETSKWVKSLYLPL